MGLGVEYTESFVEELNRDLARVSPFISQTVGVELAQYRYGRRGL